jgi:hypothetical protein
VVLRWFGASPVRAMANVVATIWKEIMMSTPPVPTAVTAQERWHATFEKIDRSCPSQRADESSTDYLRRLSVIGKKYLPWSEDVKRVKFQDGGLPDDLVEKFSELVREAVERNLRRTDNMASGEMRAISVVDENTGAKQRHWIGPDSFVKSMGLPVRRVLRINVPPMSTLYSADRSGMRGIF